MSKRDNRRVLLTDYKDKKRREGSIEIETDDGQVFTVDPPELWPDVKFSDLENEAVGRLLLGDEPFERFIAAGGTATILLGILNEKHDLTVGESEASSSS